MHTETQRENMENGSTLLSRTFVEYSFASLGTISKRRDINNIYYQGGFKRVAHNKSANLTKCSHPSFGNDDDTIMLGELFYPY